MELDRKSVIVGAILAAFAFGCASATFPYKYYGLHAASYDGTLLGPTPTDDLPLSECAPTATDASPCTTMLTPSFLAMKQDYLDTANALNACQHGKLLEITGKSQ